MTGLAHVLSTITKVSLNELRTILGGIVFDDKELFAVGDRGNFLHAYFYDAEKNCFNRANTFQAHDHWISALAYLKPCDRYPKGALVTGSHDKTIKIWGPECFAQYDSVKPIPLETFSHDAEVCFITTTPDNTGRIISCGWDSTCRIWGAKSEKTIILRHEQYAIWSAAAIPGGYVTCGADKTIRIWSETGEPIHTIKDAHKDAIRGSVFIPSKNVLATCANDGTIKEWQVNGLELTYLSTISCTDSYLYSISLLNDDTYIVSSEDRCVYIASSDTKKVEDVLPLPDVVFSVSKLLNNDILCSCVDGYTRTFTNDKSRRCDNPTETKYLQALTSLTFSNPELANINPLDLPDIHTLTADNAAPGSATLVRNGDQMVICTWSNGYHKWLQIGTLVISKEGQSKQKVADEYGKLWDYCFTVQMEDGRTFPLYMNYDTNEYTAAYDFMTKHNLDPQAYLMQIIDFIHKNRGKTVIESTQSNSIFPKKDINYYSEINTTPIVNKLRSNNKSQKNQPVLTEEQLSALEKPLSHEVFEVIETIILNWPYDQMWPVLDILRARITDPQARNYIPCQKLVRIVHHLEKADPASSPEFLILMIARVVSNMFMNYNAEIMTEINVFEILNRFSNRFITSSPRTQVAYSTLVYNYSTILSFNPDMCVNLMNLIIENLAPSLDAGAMMRMLYACGNVATFSNEAKMKLQLHPEVITNIRSSGQISNDINVLLTGLSNLISS